MRTSTNEHRSRKHRVGYNTLYAARNDEIDDHSSVDSNTGSDTIEHLEQDVDFQQPQPRQRIRINNAVGHRNDTDNNNDENEMKRSRTQIKNAARLKFISMNEISKKPNNKNSGRLLPSLNVLNRMLSLQYSLFDQYFHRFSFRFLPKLYRNSNSFPLWIRDKYYKKNAVIMVLLAIEVALLWAVNFVECPDRSYFDCSSAYMYFNEYSIFDMFSIRNFNCEIVSLLNVSPFVTKINHKQNSFR